MSVDSISRERWGIVGGGMLGMTLAYRLAQQGRDVTLFEAADHCGGLASAWSLGDVVWDRHYHVILRSDRFLRSLLGELDLEKEIRWTTTKTGFFTEGHLHSLSNAWEFLRFPALNLWDKTRLAVTILHAAHLKDWQGLEHIRVDEWLRRWSGKRATEKIWIPLLRAKLSENYTKASAAFIWAIIQRMYGARRSTRRVEEFGYVPGGYARILDRFATALVEAGVRVRPRSRVKQLRALNGGVRVALDDGHVEMVDRCIVTAAAPQAERLCEGLNQDERARMRGITYQGVVCASLLLKQPLSEFYITNITDSNIPFTAVIEMSALVDRSLLNGKTLVYLPKYVVPDSPWFEKDEAEIRECFFEGIKKIHPSFGPEQVEAFRVSRVRYVLPISTLGYSEGVPNKKSSVPGLYIVNSAHILNGTLNVNETVQLAEQSIKEMLSAGQAVSIENAGYEIKKTLRQSVA
ncbi:MAG: NAD(P)/FAD-dependent oxidoreductase [Acidobacteriia bacterium]|nr:NAD(P)/FAD-dependent oxidoreductase [Terriglobia bacterium]